MMILAKVMEEAPGPAELPHLPQSTMMGIDLHHR
jgi:hypothetical protein